MTTYQCTKGCRDPKAKDGLMWHYSPNECPHEVFNPNVHPGRPGKQRSKNHPGTPAQPAKAAEVTPRARVSVGSGEGITFTDSKAQVTKGTSKPTEPVVVDYIVDAPHTKAFCNFVFRGAYFVHVKVDEYLFDWHKHLPKEQFQLTKNAEMSIEMDPRNLYSRAVTWFTKNVCQCKNLQAAHSAIDGILFFEAFGGIGVALIFHYEEVYKNSPKMKKKREEAARKKAIRAGQVLANQTGVTNEGIPVFTAVTS
jgi:hypothetical protein